jgi:hypothetical protein
MPNHAAFHLQTSEPARRFYEFLRREVLPISPSQYDISDICNLRCEGCFFFVGHDHDGHGTLDDLKAVDAFFGGEAARGVSYAEVAGAEPSLAEAKLAIMARHIPKGVIYTNGVRRITSEIGYRLQVSLWGLPRQSARLRGANVVAKQMRNYRDDPRAVFVFTVNRLNVRSIPELVEFCANEGARLTFNHFSPTQDYLDRLGQTLPERDDYFRFSDGGENLVLGPDDLRRSEGLIAEALERRPDTVVYDAGFNAWIHGLGSLHRVDPATGVAVDCAGRLTRGYRHFHTDLTDAGDVKCPTPNIACETCRCYAQSLGTALHRLTTASLRRRGVEQWLRLWRLWLLLFWGDLPEGVDFVSRGAMARDAGEAPLARAG